jgi:hypothetical protein
MGPAAPKDRIHSLPKLVLLDWLRFVAIDSKAISCQLLGHHGHVVAWLEIPRSGQLQPRFALSFRASRANRHRFISV